MSSEETILIAVELGRTSPYLEVPELVIRQVDDEPAEEDTFEEEGAPAAPCYRLQGRLVNKTSKKLSSVKYDVSFYDAEGRFLGLNKCGFLDDEEIDAAHDYLAIDLELQLPAETARCVFNCRALKAGWLIGRLLWG